MFGVGRKRYDSLASSGAGSDNPDVCDVWEDFAANGRNSDMDDAPQLSPSTEQSPSFGDLFNGFNAFHWNPAPRAITGRHLNWWKQDADLWSQTSGHSDTDTAVVMMNAVRVLDAVRSAADEFGYKVDGTFCQRQYQHLQQQHQQQQSRQWTRPMMRSGVTGAQQSCSLCRTNGERRSVYESHALKDDRGLVTCPVLSRYVCPFCGATGRFAHTLRYCPFAPDGASVVKTLKTNRDSAGRRVR